MTIVEQAARIVDAVREQNPLVDCITNAVTVNDCANALLAFGASPAMCDVFDEAYEFSRISGAVYINFGTYTKEQETAALQSVLGARRAAIPIVIDPVGCAAMPKRIHLLDHLYHVAGVDVIKGNSAEIMALAGQKSDAKGVDSTGENQGIEEAARALARKYRCTVAATGKDDVVTDGEQMVRLHNGHELLTKITGSGCMVGALCGATAAAVAKLPLRPEKRTHVTEETKKHLEFLKTVDMFAATVTGILALSIAGENAAERATLPGSFRVALIDSLATVTGQEILQKARIESRDVS